MCVYARIPPSRQLQFVPRWATKICYKNPHTCKHRYYALFCTLCYKHCTHRYCGNNIKNRKMNAIKTQRRRQCLTVVSLQELVEDVAIATSSRHTDLSWARRFAVASPRFIGRRSASTVLSQDCLGRPALRLQSPGGSIMQASRARWWSCQGSARWRCPVVEAQKIVQVKRQQAKQSKQTRSSWAACTAAGSASQSALLWSTGPVLPATVNTNQHSSIV